MNAWGIDGVIAHLDRIRDRERAKASRLGYFPALCRRVTVEIKRGIETGVFGDPGRAGDSCAGRRERGALRPRRADVRVGPGAFQGGRGWEASTVGRQQPVPGGVGRGLCVDTAREPLYDAHDLIVTGSCVTVIVILL
jgi:hypothetical protein